MCVCVCECNSVIASLSNLHCQVLDDITLSNLDVLDNHGHTAGTLLEKVDHCSTLFGGSTSC